MKGYWIQQKNKCDLVQSDFQNALDLINGDLMEADEVNNEINEIIDENTEIQFQLPSE